MILGITSEKKNKYLYHVTIKKNVYNKFTRGFTRSDNTRLKGHFIKKQAQGFVAKKNKQRLSFF